MVRTLVLAAAVLAVVQQPAAPVAPPDTEIFLAPLTPGAVPGIGRPVNVTKSPGYDNQPSFTPDGAGMLFTSNRGGTQTDIYRYAIASGVTTRVTNTMESEYSPTVTPDGKHISVIRVEADGTQRLWRFTINGQAPELLLPNVKPVGYHAWSDDHTLALFVLGTPSTLQLADTRRGTSAVLVRHIGRSLQRIPGGGTISFVQRVGATPAGEITLSINELNPQTHRITHLVDVVSAARDADVAWTPDGMLVMARNDVLYGWKRPSSVARGAAAWTRIADLAALGLHGVSRIAISPKGDRIAFVTQ